jgi:hypothetical protein
MARLKKAVMPDVTAQEALATFEMAQLTASVSKRSDGLKPSARFVVEPANTEAVLVQS